MLNRSVDGAARFAASNADFIRREILRVGAPAQDLKSALDFVAQRASFDPHAYEALPPRMRRLVDLLAVADDGLSISLIEASTQPDPAVA